MDLRLPLLADANLHLSVAEEALEESAYITARSEFDKATAALDELREMWPTLSDDSERGLLAAMAKPLSERAQAIERALPKQVALAVGEAVVDPEQESEPELV